MYGLRRLGMSVGFGERLENEMDDVAFHEGRGIAEWRAEAMRQSRGSGEALLGVGDESLIRCVLPARCGFLWGRFLEEFAVDGGIGGHREGGGRWGFLGTLGRGCGLGGRGGAELGGERS